MMRYRLPAKVLMPDDPIIASDHLMIILDNISPQNLYFYRKCKGFPNSIREGNRRCYVANDVVRWMESNGIMIERASNG